MNVENRTLFTGDNLPVLQNMDSNSVDLIYLDPPFNSNRTYAAPIGSKAAMAAFKDTWTFDDVDEAWIDNITAKESELATAIGAAGAAYDESMQSYLTMMGIRLLEMERVLRPKGSIWLHCDDTAVHYLKTVMDAIFGTKRFQNEIVWKRTGGHSNTNRFARVSDRILFYGSKIRKNKILAPLPYEKVRSKFPSRDSRGRYYAQTLLVVGPFRTGQTKPYKGFDPTSRDASWCVPRTGAYADWIETRFIPGYTLEKDTIRRLEMLDAHDFLHWTRSGVPRYKWYHEAHQGQNPTDIWTDIKKVSSGSKERTKYPTQKPEALLERIIKASSKEGDVVLDPFCGTATTLVVAEGLKRHWIGIDLSKEAAVIVKKRLRAKIASGGLIFGHLGKLPEIHHERKLPKLSGDNRLPANWKLDFRAERYVKQDKRCGGCRWEMPEHALALDHIIPKSKGGPDRPANLQMLCSYCNSTKGAHSMRHLEETLVRRGKMHPDYVSEVTARLEESHEIHT